MLELSKPTMDKLRKEGFSPDEISGIQNDLTHLIEQSNRYSVDYINQELENLGWGIDLFDEFLLKEIMASCLVSRLP